MVFQTLFASIFLSLLLIQPLNAAAVKAATQQTIASTKTKAATPTKPSPSKKHIGKRTVAKKPLKKTVHPKKTPKPAPLPQKSLNKPTILSTMPKIASNEPNKALESVYHQKKSSTSSLQPDNHRIQSSPPESPDDDNEGEDDDDDDSDDDDDEPTPAPPNKKIMIRVLLKEAPTSEKVTFTIQSNKGFVLESPIGSRKRASWKHEILNILAYEGNLFLLTAGGTYKRIKTNELAIAPVAGDLKIDNFRYSGTIYLRIDQKTKMVQMVNKINLDDYIYAVLRYESLSYWPLEMQKVQAVASRSYAVRQIKTARGSNTGMPFYDIKNNNFHQVYNGNHDYVHLRKAVEQTHNLILTYNGDIALTMFDICCGGIIPGYMKKRDADKPYLYRKTRCTYCHDKANYEWHCAFDKDTLLKRMLDNHKVAAKTKKLGKITGISLKEKDKAGIVHRVLIHGSKNNISFTNNEFKSALGARAKSNAYVVKKLQDDIMVHGYGFGHNMGLCQIGARELVSRGWSYSEILNFYFPKTKLMRLKVI